VRRRSIRRKTPDRDDGNAYLKQDGKGAADVGPAERIVFWLDDERMEVSPGRVVLPPGSSAKGRRSFCRKRESVI
jgi:hypothetical protein